MGSESEAGRMEQLEMEQLEKDSKIKKQIR